MVFDPQPHLSRIRVYLFQPCRDFSFSDMYGQGSPEYRLSYQEGFARAVWIFRVAFQSVSHDLEILNTGSSRK